MATLREGEAFPAFELPDAEGGTLRLADFAGKAFVIYFYPKDDTSGCTVEAKDFSALADAFARIDTAVIGVSPDPAKSHEKFRDKHGLTVRLASDEDKSLIGALGLWVEKSMYGKTYLGVERTTFLIGADARVARAWPKVRVAGHAEEVLAAARALRTTG